MKNHLNSIWLSLFICLLAGQAKAQTAQADPTRTVQAVRGNAAVSTINVPGPDKTREAVTVKPAPKAPTVTKQPSSSIDLSRVNQPAAKPKN